MRSTLASGFAAVMLAAAALAGPAAAADQARTIEVGGLSRRYLVHTPDAKPPPGGFPVIFALHGGGGQARSMARLSGLDGLADARGFIVVYPDGHDRHWNDGRASIKRKDVDDVAFIAAVLDEVEREDRVDRARVFATGISNGAVMTERLGCELSDRIAAIAPVAGTLAADLAPACRPARPVAVMQIGGTADPIMPYGGGAVADFGGRGEGGVVLSDAATVAGWARRNGCAAADTRRTLPPAAAADGDRVVETRYQGCPRGGGVVLLTVEGGGHTWPGGPQYLPAMIVGRASRQIDASRAIVDFFLGSP